MFEVWDSCFSFNVEFFVLVDRHSSIRVEYFDQRGRGHQVEVMGALSELLQHEIDHLDGVLAIDRMKDTKGVIMRSEWKKRVEASRNRL
jgi:peptide deformylase